MRTTFLGLMAAVLLLVPRVAAQEIAKKEFEKLQGTWTFDSYEEGGQKTPAADLQEKRIFFGANQFIVKNGDELVQVGSLKLDPIDGHRDIDATVAAGLHKGNTMLGIYSLKDNVFKVCIDPEGNERPKEFKTTADSGLFLAVYKRVIPTGEEVDISGQYKSESLQFTGEKQQAEVEIKRLGDCYLVKWSKGILDAYVGIGLRKGEVLAVCWANQGQIGACLYQIEKGPRLTGVWTMLGGAGVVQRETLTARKKKKE
jgi:uncharacterized protein (TIGR03067 family)